MKTETYTCDHCTKRLEHNWFLVEVPEPRSELCIEAAKHFCSTLCLVVYYYNHSYERDQIAIRHHVE